MTPSELFRLIRYLRFREETWKRIRYWLRERHPEYGLSNGLVLWAAVAVLLTLMTFSVSIGSEDYTLLLLPAAYAVASGYVWLVHRAHRADRSPARKFGKKRRR